MSNAQDFIDECEGLTEQEQADHNITKLLQEVKNGKVK